MIECVHVLSHGDLDPPEGAVAVGTKIVNV
jgi:hypothetical protein